MSANLPLQIQTLGGFREQTLVLTHVVSLQAPGGIVSGADVLGMYLKLRVPLTSNVGRDLARLQDAGHVMQPSSGRWSVTPLGLERIRQLMAGVSDAELARVLESGTGEATFGEARHHLIPAELAPAEFQQGIARFLEGHAFERNVFGISRFPRGEGDIITSTLAVCREACLAHGLDFHLAADRAVEDYIPKNVAASIWACKYGIAIIEDRVAEGLNYNVIFEVGAMLVTGRRGLLLKDKSIPELPTDLVGHIYTPVDIGNRASVTQAVEDWITKSLGIP